MQILLYQSNWKKQNYVWYILIFCICFMMMIQDCVANGYLNTIPVAGRMVGRRDVSFINSSHDTVSQSATAFQNESTQSQVSKDRNKRTVTPCSKCCTSNLCNSDSCQHVQPHATSPPSTASPTTVSTQVLYFILHLLK